MAVYSKVIIHQWVPLFALVSEGWVMDEASADW